MGKTESLIDECRLVGVSDGHGGTLPQGIFF